MKKIWVTGASGFIGWPLANALVGQYEVVGSYQSRKVSSPDFPIFQVDLTQEDEVIAAFATIKPDMVFHCAAMSQPNQCELNQKASYEINVSATQILAQLCASQGAKLIFTSTDLVFDGVEGNYAEEAPVAPLNVYGQHKAEAERRIVQHCQDYAVCRMPLMFGTPTHGASSFLQGFLTQLEQGQPLTLFYDEYRSILHEDDAVAGLIWAAQNVKGIIHLGGKDRMSRYDFGLLLAEKLGYSIDLIQKVSQKEVTMAAKRAADASLNSRFAFASGFRPKTVEERLMAMVEPS